MAFTPCGNDRVSLYTSLGNVHHTVSVFCQDADVAAAAIILKTFNFVGNDEHLGSLNGHFNHIIFHSENTCTQFSDVSGLACGL